MQEPVSLNRMQYSPLEAAVFAYGALGGAEPHLLTALEGKHPQTPRILELLGWIGSPDMAQVVARVARETEDLDTFKKAVVSLRKLGGLEGRDLLLAMLKTVRQPDRKAYLRELEPELRVLNPESAATDLRLRTEKDPKLPDLSKALEARMHPRLMLRDLAAARTDALRTLAPDALPYVEQVNRAIEAIGLRDVRRP